MPNDLHEKSAVQPLLTQGDVAQLLGVSPATIGRWARNGQLPVILLPSGRRRFRREDVEGFLQIGEIA